MLQPLSTAKASAPSIPVLVAISTLSPLSMNIYLPSLSGMMQAFGATAAEVQLTMSLPFVAIALAQLVLGPLSDRYGRRPVVLIGMAVYTLGSVLCLLAPTVELLIAARIVQAVGGSAGLTLARAIVRDLYDRDRAASMIGYVTMGMTVGPTFGPAIGGFLDASYGWRGGFWLMLILGASVLAASFLTLHETNKVRAHGTAGVQGLVRNYRSLIREPVFWAFALTACFTSSVYFAYLGGTPFIAAGQLGMRPEEMGFYFMFVGLGYFVGNGISGRVASRVGLVPMVVTGTVFPTLAIACLVIGTMVMGIRSELMLFLPMVLVGLGNGLCLPSAMSGAVSVRPDLAGSASGLIGSLQVGMGAVSSTLVAWLLSDTMFPQDSWPMVLVMGIYIVLTWCGILGIFTSGRQAEA
ncbi:multidrug effflux MFS transporter [Roseibium litorale]|uniref:Bcr/CflA family efflux transporter n=1 Tax=Roseibium litorale TaxID=2803841 RepID=A0ABR9CT14_9HYPH|nr:multidrug effflux MFS transporter [Roseibium litorale]MBD8893426.1 multidrug effflux MFS transporter [Roseibium litorale]